MKKRIRKKKHLGEFEKYGILIKFDVTENETEDAMDMVNDFADSHNLYSWGGGYGRFSMQHVKDNYNVPTVVVEIIKAIANGANEKPMFSFIRQTVCEYQKRPWLNSLLYLTKAHITRA